MGNGNRAKFEGFADTSGKIINKFKEPFKYLKK